MSGHPAPAERRRRACWARSRAVAVGPFTERSCNTSTAAAIRTFNRSRVCALAASSLRSWLIPWPPLPARLGDLGGARSRHRPGDRRNPGAVRSQPPAGPAAGADQRTGPAHQAPGSLPAVFVRQGLEVVHRVTDHDRAVTLVRAGGYWRVVRFRPSARVPESVADRSRDVAGRFGLRCFVTPATHFRNGGSGSRGGRGATATCRLARQTRRSLSRRNRDVRLVIHTDHPAGGWFLDVPGDPGALHAGPRDALAGAGRGAWSTAGRPSPAATAATCPAGRSR